MADEPTSLDPVEQAERAGETAPPAPSDGLREKANRWLDANVPINFNDANATFHNRNRREAIAIITDLLAATGAAVGACVECGAEPGCNIDCPTCLRTLPATGAAAETTAEDDSK